MTPCSGKLHTGRTPNISRPAKIPRIRFLPLALLALGQGLYAQQIPNAGSQIQQIPQAPVPQKAPPEISIERRAAPVTPGTQAAPDTARIFVRALHVTGAQAYSETELIAITGFVPGTELTIGELRAMASRITTHYAQNGYFVARAYLPAQQIQGNTVTIEVSEGKYGKIILRNQTNLADAQALRLLEGLNSGDPITNDPLESRLLLLSDTPGVHVNSTLVPGATPGSSDLIVDLTPGKRVSGEVDIDNAGSRYTGEVRVGTTVNLNNPLGLGDVAAYAPSPRARAWPTAAPLTRCHSARLPSAWLTAGFNTSSAGNFHRCRPAERRTSPASTASIR